MTFANNFDTKYENDSVLTVCGILQYLLETHTLTHTHTGINYKLITCFEKVIFNIV